MSNTDLFDPAGLQEGEGATDMVLFAHEGKVIQRFAKPMLFVAYDRSNAVDIGKRLIDCAVECGADVRIEVPRRQISKQKRDALIVRCIHLMRSLGEKNRAPTYIAREIVDSLLSAVD